MLNFTFSLTELEFFLLILMRVATFMYVAPFFSTNNTPKRVKVAFSVLVAYMLYRLMPGGSESIEYSTVFGYAVLVLKEALTGLLIGYGANICTLILNLAGHISDMETGLSMVTIFDPTTRENVTITGAFYQYAVTLILMISGMYQFVLRALAETFKLIPINGAVFSSDKLVRSMAIFLCDYASIGFRICLPIFGVMLILNSLLGILAKVSPQMNMFAVGMQLKVLTGLTVLFITVSLLPNVSDLIYSEVKKMVTLFTESLL
ncbi:MAG: flagellar biosynthetic protein FliR [Lachnospiraceae bacterium]|nr:flagellar biosynthetic protein FliR [Lachnospiraceae bacterium]